jgi:hypothetical protein
MSNAEAAPVISPKHISHVVNGSDLVDNLEIVAAPSI